MIQSYPANTPENVFDNLKWYFMAEFKSCELFLYVIFNSKNYFLLKLR